ncbi:MULTISPECIES: hypothetical protein [unclassified Mesorhizobium]|nr:MULTISPECIES: hypothetical protein [unclassified Mesorhizobium]
MNRITARPERSAMALNGSTPAAMAGRAKRVPIAWPSALRRSVKQ